LQVLDLILASRTTNRQERNIRDEQGSKDSHEIVELVGEKGIFIILFVWFARYHDRKTWEETGSEGKEERIVMMGFEGKQMMLKGEIERKQMSKCL
jgi:hypothetical protein